MGSELVDDRASGIAQPQHLGNFVEGFPGSVVAGVADIFVGPRVRLLPGKIEMRVSAGDYQSEYRKLEFGVSVALRCSRSTAWMWPSRWLTAMSGLSERKGQRFGEADAYQQRSRETGALGDGDRVDGFVGLICLR